MIIIGRNTFMVGDGFECKITYFSKIFLLIASTILLLNDVLHNLFNVSKLIFDNNVLIKFFDFICLIKDKLTGTYLLQGKLIDMLYCLQLFNPKFFSQIPWSTR